MAVRARCGTLAGVGLVAGAPLALAPGGAHAIEVTNANPSGPGSLANAVFAVNSSPTEDTITFASSLSGQTITTAGQLYFDADEVSIIGPGADKLTISGNDTHRIFGFNPDSEGDRAEVRGLTLTRGNATGSNSGGAIANVNADLVVANTVISRSTGSNGGGIWTGDNLETTIERSTITGNTATSGGGGIYADGDFGTVRSSTITGNTARIGAGVTSNGAVSFYDSTIAGNSSTSTSSSAKGAGIYNESGDTTFFLFGTIVSGNHRPGGGISDLSGPFMASASLIQGPQDATIAVGPAGPNLLGVDPRLGGLAANGGPTPTMRPQPTSPALDKSRVGGPATDQRGLRRPFDIPSIANAGAGGADMGAVELQASELKGNCKKKRKKGKGRSAAPAAKKKKKKKCKKKRKKGKK